MKRNSSFAELLLAICTAIFVISSAGCRNPQLHAFAGRWLLKSHGKNMMLLTIVDHHDRLNGSLITPVRATEYWQGEFTGIFLPIVKRPLRGKPKGKAIEIVLGPKSDQDRALIKLADRNHLLIAFYHGVVPDWSFERVSGRQPIRVSSNWPKYDDDPEIVEIREQLQAMAEADKTAREKRWIDPKEMAILAEKATPLLQSVFNQYGWPKISMFDVTPCDDFWILVQHQPPAVQEAMLPGLKEAVEEGEASKVNYAYLFDRVQTDKGKPQHWGTQSKCENGRAVLYPVDDSANLDKRRKIIGLGPLDESIEASDQLCQHVRN